MIFLSLLVFLSSAQGADCDWLLKLRDLRAYDQLFMPAHRAPKLLPSQAIQDGSNEDLVLDVAAGEANALRELRDVVGPRVKLLAVSQVHADDFYLRQALREDANLIYLSGETFESRFAGRSLNRYKGRGSVVIDAFGSATYSRNPFESILMEIIMAKLGGVIFTMIPLRVKGGAHGTYSRPVFKFLPHDSDFHSLANNLTDSLFKVGSTDQQTVRLVQKWLRQVTGVHVVDSFVQVRSGFEFIAIVLRRNSERVSTPAVEPIEFIEGIPPLRQFRSAR